MAYFVVKGTIDTSSSLDRRDSAQIVVGPTEQLAIASHEKLGASAVEPTITSIYLSHLNTHEVP